MNRAFIRGVGLLAAGCFVSAALAQQSVVRTSYRVTQVASGVVYLDGGSHDGLAEGMRLKVSHLAPGEALMNRKEVATVSVMAVAGNSAACEIKESTAAVQVGDSAELFASDVQILQIVQQSKSHRKYAQVVSFTEGDPVEAELREYVPKPPSPEVNRVRGRIGFDQNVILDHTTGLRTLQEGMVVRADMTRIAGSFWNFTGYWRGRLSNESGPNTVTTLNDLLNRTYQIGLYYNNPTSRWVAGFGRYLLPWAASLNTMDGGYLARRVRRDVTVGVFGGSTPDPTAWNYDPNRQVFGSFVALEQGSFETMRFTSTAGAAVTRSHWQPERQFLFFENSFSVNTKVTVYHNLEVDKLARALTADGNNGVRMARSFLTVRIQPVKIFSIDLNHNYFRDVPTFDTRLIGTGLLDKYLFQGFSAGFRLDLPINASLYTSLGSNKRDTDTKSALNYMTGLTFNRIPVVPVRLDLRYSRFNSSFGAGGYQSVSVSRQIGEKLRFEFNGGLQNLKSSFTSESQARFVEGNLDYLIGLHYILGLGWTAYRGNVQDYDQMFLNLGYRF